MLGKHESKEGWILMKYINMVTKITNEHIIYYKCRCIGKEYLQKLVQIVYYAIHCSW